MYFQYQKTMCILCLIFEDLRLEINLVMRVEKAKELDKSHFIIFFRDNSFLGVKQSGTSEDKHRIP